MCVQRDDCITAWLTECSPQFIWSWCEEARPRAVNRQKSNPNLDTRKEYWNKNIKRNKVEQRRELFAVQLKSKRAPRSEVHAQFSIQFSLTKGMFFYLNMFNVPFHPQYTHLTCVSSAWCASVVCVVDNSNRNTWCVCVWVYSLPLKIQCLVWFSIYILIK